MAAGVDTGQDGLVLNSVLCFAQSKFGVIGYDRMKKLLFDFYGSRPELITEAKKRLLADGNALTLQNMLPRFPDRQGINKYENEVKDILDLFTLLDQMKAVDALPIYVTDDVDAAPRVSLEVGDMKLLMYKLDRMEMCMKEMQGAIHRLYSECPPGLVIQGPKDAPNNHSSHTAQRSSTPAHAVVQTTSNQARVYETDQSNGRNTSKNPASQRTWAQRASNGRNDVTTHGNRFDGYDSTNEDDEEYVLAMTRRQKRRRLRSRAMNNDNVLRTGQSQFIADPRQSHSEARADVGDGRRNRQQLQQTKRSKYQPLLYGLHQSSSGGESREPSLRAAKTLKSVYCVDNVSDQYDCAALATYLIKHGVRVITCYEVKPRTTRWQRSHKIQPDHKAFRVCINRADNSRFLDASLWPLDITVSRWYSKKDQNENAEQNDAQAAHDEHTLSGLRLHTESADLTSLADQETVGDRDQAAEPLEQTVIEVDLDGTMMSGQIGEKSTNTSN
jgi:hypothetical protein